MSPTFTTKSFLDFATDSAQLFLQDELGCNSETRDCLVGLLGDIPSFSEEGKRGWPNIILTKELEYVTKILPYKTIVEIGARPNTSDGIKSIFKSLAPICELPWIGWICITDATITFGLISCENNQTSLSLLRHFENSRPEWPHLTIYAEPLSSSVLALHGKNRCLHLSFSLKKYRHDDKDYILELMESILSSIEEGKTKDKLKSVMIKLLTNAVTKSHGCIISIIPKSGVEHWKKNNPDGTWITAPINVMQYVIEYEEAERRKSDETYYESRLRSCINLISSMIQQDGISIFSDDGVFFAYRVFVQIGASGSGGSRSRAFKQLVNMRPLKAAYFRSHDGHSEFNEVI